jgi:hypothetical protein
LMPSLDDALARYVVECAAIAALRRQRVAG